MNKQYTIHTQHTQASGRLRRFLNNRIWNRFPVKYSVALSLTTMVLGLSAAAFAAMHATDSVTSHANTTNKLQSSSTETIENDDLKSADELPPSNGTHVRAADGTVTINGQTYAASDNGSLHKTITTGNGSTVQIDIDNSQSAPGNSNNSSRSSTSLSVRQYNASLHGNPSQLKKP